MQYSLEFKPSALKEWKKLDNTVRTAFKQKLFEILNNPKVDANKLAGLPDCYKVKLRAVGYRLVYQVVDERVVVLVLSVGKRDKQQAYEKAKLRL